MRKLTMAIALAMATASFVPSVALAGDLPTNTKEGAQRFAEGNRLYTEHDYDGARLKFLQALAIAKSKNLLFNLARAEEKSGHFADAYGHYQDYVALKETTAAEKVEPEQYMAELVKKIGRVRLEAPAGSHVQVDGRDIGEAPFVALVAVPGGEHRFTLGTESKSVMCASGTTVTVALGAVPTPPPGETSEGGSWAVPAVLAGVGLAGLGVGIGLSAASSSVGTSGIDLFRGGACADLSSSTCRTAQDKESSSGALGYGGVVGYAAGGAFLVASVVTALVMKPWKPRERGREVTLVPSIGGMALIGKF